MFGRFIVISDDFFMPINSNKPEGLKSEVNIAEFLSAFVSFKENVIILSISCRL